MERDNKKIKQSIDNFRILSDQTSIKATNS